MNRHGSPCFSFAAGGSCYNVPVLGAFKNPSYSLCNLFIAGGSNYNVPVPGASGASLSKDNPLAAFDDELSRTIVDLEVNADQWTLMHRYNKAADLVEQVLQVWDRSWFVHLMGRQSQCVTDLPFLTKLSQKFGVVQGRHTCFVAVIRLKR
jgi:hypothetical protein